MKVAENDDAVHGMLKDEQDRCRDALSSLLAQFQQYPKGALNVRRKAYKDKGYLYHYLVYREGQRVVNRHVSAAAIPELKRQLERRNRCWDEIKIYRRRLAYLDRLLHLSPRCNRRKA
jgi:hypothetical protein